MHVIIINFIVKHHVLQTFPCIVLYENMKNNQNICLANDSHYKVMKNLSIEYVIADEIIKSLFFVYISLATLTSLNCNVENSTKAWYVDETDSYHFF